MSDAESSSSSSSSSLSALASPPSERKSAKKKKKRTANNSSRTSVEICVQKSNPAVDPVLCSFPSGLPSSCLSSNNNNNNNSNKDNDMPKFVWDRYGSRPGGANGGSGAAVAAAAAAGRSLMGEDSACLYTSHASPAEMERRHTQVCVGIYDKETGKLTIQPVACQGHVFALSQSVPTYGTTNTSEQQQQQHHGNLTQAEQHGRALFEDFGSAKKRKVLKSQAANRVTVDSVIGAGKGGGGMVSTFLKGQSMSESNRQAVAEQQQQQQQAEKEGGVNNNNNMSSSIAMPRTSSAVDAATEQWRSNFLPKYNLHATEAFEVYSMKDIAGANAWERISSKVTRCLADDETDDPIAAFVQGSRRNEDDTPVKDDDEKKAGKEGPPPPYKRGPQWNTSLENLIRVLVPRHGKIGSASNELVHMQLICTVLLNHFVNLFNRFNKARYIPALELDRPKYFGVPSEVGERWLQLFTTATTNHRTGEAGHVMSKLHRDKCSVHMLLMYLVATSGKSVQAADIKPLAKDLAMDLRDAMHLLRLAGCKVTRNTTTGKTGAVLKVPLKFPPPPRRMGGGGRR